MMKAKILNIETSTRICSVSLAYGDEIVAARERENTFEHAKILHPFIQDVMDVAHWSPSDLNAVAVSEGPGSYTGLRIGVSAAKGLCFALNIPLIAVSTLKAMALHAAEELNYQDVFYVPMIDARRMEVYSAVFDNQGRLFKKVDAEIIGTQSFEEFYQKKQSIYFGDGALKCQSVFEPVRSMRYHKGGFPSARFMNQLAQDKFVQKDFQDVAYFEPFYLKDFVAAKPKVKGLNM
ncbi:MAG: tRNA (adenosine(37)-N6)-threonylcarbamoyltransferase complex dimerization subunit type 1 TsaB [Bacteroidales bacterium]